MQGGLTIANTYLHFLVEESLAEGLANIVVPYIGILQIREIDPKGRKWRYYTSDGVRRTRTDTVFDENVMYKVYFRSYIKTKIGSLVNFGFSKRVFKHILYTLYKKELEPGAYPFAKIDRK